MDFGSNTITPYGWSQQTSTPTQPLNANPTQRLSQIAVQQPQMPRWYGGLMKMGQQQFVNNGGSDPAGLQSGGDWFRNYYGGYNGSTPVQQGLLGLASQNLASHKLFGRMGIAPQQAGALSQDYLSQYAQNGMNGVNSGNINSGLRGYLADLGFPRNGGQSRGLLG